MREIVDKITHRPRRCSWELTLACNLRCRHCGSAAGQARSDELSTDEALSVCDQLAGLACTEATLLGGEPFLRRDWQTVAERLLSHGMDVNILSNGSLIDETLASRLEEVGINRVGISIDGLEETHNSIRNHAESFGQCLRAIHCLRARHLSVCVVTVVLPQNLGELPRLFHLLEEIGVEHWQLQLPVPTGRLEAEGGPLGAEAVSRVVDFMATRKGTSPVHMYAGCTLGYFSDQEDRIRTPHGEGLGFWTGCYAGVLMVAIRSNGDVTGCLTMPEELTEGNVRERSLEAIWHADGAFGYNRDFRKELLSGFCAECQFGELCRGGCRSISHYTTGSLFNDVHCHFRLLYSPPSVEPEA